MCKNALRIQRQQLESRLLAGLRNKVLKPEFVEYVIAGIQEEFEQQREAIGSWLRALREEKRQIEIELKRLIETITSGNGSPTVMAAISQREARLREMTDQANEPGTVSLGEKLDELRKLALARLDRLQDLLQQPTAVHEARALLAEQIGKFKLERVSEGSQMSFTASGEMNFFEEEALHAWMVPGARIELATPAFSGRRSTNERGIL